MLAVDPKFLKTLLTYVKAAYLPEKRRNPKYPDTFTSGDIHFFAPAVAELSAAFTFERTDRHANYFNAREARASYLLYFLAPNMLKVEWILAQQRLTEVFAAESEVRVADIGCGPCTGLLAVAQHWQKHAPQQKLVCVGVDQNGPVLKDGKVLFDRHSREGGNPELSTHACPGDMRNLRKVLGAQKFNILIIANVLNELADTEARYEFVQQLMENFLLPQGRLIIIEPALQRATRDLMLLRDQLVCHPERSEGSKPIATVLAPCTHQALCPMRAHNPRDWCHTYLEWERPQVIADLDMLIGNKKDYLKMSYMVMVHDRHSREGGNPENIKNIWRVVSAPMKSKGKMEILMCGADGKLLRVTRLDKDKTPFNTPLEALSRGDLVNYRGSPDCTRETVVTPCNANSTT